MGKVIAVFNTKGVWQIDDGNDAGRGHVGIREQERVGDRCDPQTSVSIMLTPTSQEVPEAPLLEKSWERAEDNNFTIVDYFTHASQDAPPPLIKYHIGAVSDVQEARSIDLMPGSMGLALFESELIEAGGRAKLELAVRTLLQEARTIYDVVLVDCPPGITSLSTFWLEHADAFLPPTTPNYLGVRGLAVTGKLKERFEAQHRRFPRTLGTIITLDANSGPEKKRKEEIIARDVAEKPPHFAGSAAGFAATGRRI